MNEESVGDEKPTAETIHALLAESSDGEALTADGFDSALIGLASGWIGNSRRILALYDYARCLEVLIDEGMDESDADEYMQFNVIGAYVGPSTPVFAFVYRPPTLIDPDEE